MEFQIEGDFTPDKPTLETAVPPDEGVQDVRLKSSLRMQYDAQVKVIREQIGSLEAVRTDLGLSQRKIAQLLLVDPSAWTRWTKQGSAPPHIWRALQWYMALKERIPGLTPAYFLHGDPRIWQENTWRQLESDREVSVVVQKGLEEQLLRLRNETLKLRRWNMVLSAAMGLLLVLLLFRIR